MEDAKATVLVVDDDVRMLRMVQQMLDLEGYRVLTAGDGQAALATFNKESPDLVLLDIMMPGMDGYAVCRRIREFSRVPIIMVSAKHNDAEKITGLDAGADDYVTKPFSAPELAARVRAALRRHLGYEERSEGVFRSGELTIDFSNRRVSVGQREIRATAVEYRLLCYLARNAGRVVTPDQVLEAAWGESYVGETHVLHVNIARLRRKLGEERKDAKFIITRPGIGYMMAKDG
ncbi:MAG: response regulator transcription factor [Chloroflexi bacterium]|nr:response regulator transcription factor [Chloroflexota bacterium]